MLKRRLFFIIAAVFLFAVPVTAKEKQAKRTFPDIVFPLNGQSFPYMENSFVFGSTYPDSRVKVNGKEVKVFPGGAFFAFIPVREGKFTIRVLSEGREGVFEEQRVIRIEKQIKSSPPSSKEIQKYFMMPEVPLVLAPGSEAVVRFMGTPGKQAFFRFEGEQQRFPMKEIKFQQYLGVYEGLYACREVFDEPKKIIFELYEGSSLIAHKECRNTLWCKVIPPSVFEISRNFARSRLYPSWDEGMMLQKGVQMESTGTAGDFVCLKLSLKEKICVNKKDLLEVKKIKYLSDAETGPAEIKEKENVVQLFLSCPRPVPFKVEEDPENRKVTLVLYSARGGLGKGMPRSKAVEKISFRQQEQDVLALDFVLPFRPVWGWDVEYLDKKLVFTIRKPVSVRQGSPLKGITICLDPGHGPDPGAVGPSRLEEKKINWMIADKVRDLLQDQGAKVVMTRSNLESRISLDERVALARKKKCHLFISIHNNSASNGTNPYDVSGTGTYYFMPASRELAACIQPELVKATGLADKGVSFGNFAVLRNPMMPAVLLEVAYIIIPEQEMMLMDEGFQKRVSEKITEGIKKFLLTH
jgi:N-acetylmuramoyl-L-alanine amidase